MIAECGTGKTLISLGAIQTHAEDRPFTAIAMVPPQLVEKWCREAMLTLPRVRVFIIDGLRTPTNSNSHHGVNEVKLRNKRIVREGLRTSLSELRLRKTSPSPVSVGIQFALLQHCSLSAGIVPSSGTSGGTPTRSPVAGVIRAASSILTVGLRSISGRGRTPAGNGLQEGEAQRNAGPRGRNKSCPPATLQRTLAGRWEEDSPLCPDRLHRAVHDDGFFDYAIADEVHELKGGDTAQGNALGTLAASARHIAVLTGTLLGGYADELFNILFRLGASRMLEEGFEYGETGVRAFTETYGLLEKITVIEPADNACSEARVTTRVRHRPGASPLLFGRFLMSLGAFVSLEDISDALPPYREEIVSVEMDQPLQKAYEDMEEDIKKALREHRGNQSVASVALNALLAYPDRPFGFGDLIGREFNPETQRREPFLIAATRDLDENFVYAKERRLVEEIKSSLERGRKVQVFAVYTQKRDVTTAAGTDPGQGRDPGCRSHHGSRSGTARGLV